MKFYGFLVLACLTVSTFSATEEVFNDNEEKPTSTQEDQFSDSKGICHGVEDVDLSDFNLKKEDIKKLVQKTIEDVRIQMLASQEDDTTEGDNSLKISVNENGLGTVRKVVITPDKTKIYTKTLKTSQASGTLTTSVSGSIQTGVNAETSGDFGFKVDASTYGAKIDSHTTVTGDITVKSNSTSKMVKKAKVNVWETDAESSSSGKISWEDEQTNVNSDAQMESVSNSHSGTVILSKKCSVSKSSSTFNTKLSGSNWSTDIDGTGKGGLYSHVFTADKNGSSLSWTFAKFYVPSNLNIVVENETMTGSSFATVKVFTETITKPMPASSENSRKFEISNEIKVRVESKTTLSKGYKVYGSGGQIMFRNTIVELTSEDLEGEDGVGKIVYDLVRKQGSPDHLLTNSFINSIMAD